MNPRHIKLPSLQRHDYKRSNKGHITLNTGSQRYVLVDSRHYRQLRRVRREVSPPFHRHLSESGPVRHPHKVVDIPNLVDRDKGRQYYFAGRAWSKPLSCHYFLPLLPVGNAFIYPEESSDVPINVECLNSSSTTRQRNRQTLIKIRLVPLSMRKE